MPCPIMSYDVMPGYACSTHRFLRVSFNMTISRALNLRAAYKRIFARTCLKSFTDISRILRCHWFGYSVARLATVSVRGVGLEAFLGMPSVDLKGHRDWDSFYWSLWHT